MAGGSSEVAPLCLLWLEVGTPLLFCTSAHVASRHVFLVLLCLTRAGEMAMPRYTGQMADWIMNEEAPEAFTNAITAMVVLTIGRFVEFAFLHFSKISPWHSKLNVVKR